MNPGKAHRQPLARLQLIISVSSAAGLAAVIVLGVILPAEFNMDPLGLGRRSGLIRLWAPDETVIDATRDGAPRAREYASAFRSDVIEIPLGTVGGGLGPYSLEYKVRMAKDTTLIYAWQANADGAAQQIDFDFHGHTLTAERTEKMVVATYRRAKGERQQGALAAPFDGIQGWYFENSSDRPVTIRLRLSGFYDLVPPGQPGNEAGIVASPPAPVGNPS